MTWMGRGDLDATTNARAFMPTAVLATCALLPIREVTTFPTGCQAPGFEGGARLTLDGTSETATNAVINPLTSTAGRV